MADTPLVNLTIEGRPVSVAPGTTILEAAKAAGVLIPHYCYHPGLSVPANCRMCLVEVKPAANQRAMMLDILKWDPAKNDYVPDRKPGERYIFFCPPGVAMTGIWGTDIYTDDSRVCTAAVTTSAHDRWCSSTLRSLRLSTATGWTPGAGASWLEIVSTALKPWSRATSR